MNSRMVHIMQKQFLNKWMWRILAVLLLGVILVPHHHHAHEDVCVRMDWAHHHAETHPSSAGECDNCCVTRFVSYRQQKAEHEKVKPVFLLSLFLSSLLFGLRRTSVSKMKRAWIVRDGAFVPDDHHVTPFGWRAPPFI